MEGPVIGIPMDYQESGGYSRFPWYALRENYLSSVEKVGGVPLSLFNESRLINRYLDMIDGLLITGAGFDIDPILYGSIFRHETVRTNPKRTSFEWEILKGALDRKMPILGICGGQQLLNVVLGGSLIQHIADEVPNHIPHFVPQITANSPCHKVTIIETSLLFKIVETSSMHVNSRHHQAVKTVGEHVIINARAEDGVIEGIEYTKHPFCVGVQWHPEFQVDQKDGVIIEAFVNAAKQYRR